jgi:hypothetical protein
MSAPTPYRTFSPEEEERRTSFLVARVEEDCAGCFESPAGSWTPAEDCPVHGAETTAWWRELNQELDAIAPGRWHR